MALDYKKCKKEDIDEYIINKGLSKEQLEDFAKVAYPKHNKKKGVNILDVEGKPITYQMKDKDGNLMFDDKGNPIMRALKKMVETNEPAPATFSRLKALSWINEHYPDDITNKPAKTKEVVEEKEDRLAKFLGIK